MPQDIHPKADVEKDDHTSSKGEFGPWSLGMTSIALVTNSDFHTLRRSGENLILSEYSEFLMKFWQIYEQTFKDQNAAPWAVCLSVVVLKSWQFALTSYTRI